MSKMVLDTDVLDGLVILPVTREIAEVAGHFKRRSKSRRLELADCLIAARPSSKEPP